MPNTTEGYEERKADVFIRLILFHVDVLTGYYRAVPARALVGDPARHTQHHQETE